MNAELEVKASWLAVAVCPGAGSQKYFHSSEHSALFRRFGISPSEWVTPVLLTPRDGFHLLATRSLVKDNSGVRREPYPSLALPHGISLKITSVRADLFPADILVARVNATIKVAEGDTETALLRLQGLRASKQIPAVRQVFDMLFALATGERLEDYPHIAYEDYFAMQLKLPYPSVRFDEFFEVHANLLVGLLIGTSDPYTLNKGLVDKVLEDSRSLNVKARAEQMLLNRKGILHVLPTGSYVGPHSDRFEKTRELAVMANFARVFLNRPTSISKLSPATSASIKATLSRWIDAPEVTLDASFSHTSTWQLLSDQLLLKKRLSSWTRS